MELMKLYNKEVFRWNKTSNCGEIGKEASEIITYNEESASSDLEDTMEGTKEGFRNDEDNWEDEWAGHDVSFISPDAADKVIILYSYSIYYYS